MDALSRAPVTATSDDIDSMELQQEAKTFIIECHFDFTEETRGVQMVTKVRYLPLRGKVLEYCQTNWPVRRKVSRDLVHYWKVRA